MRQPRFRSRLFALYDQYVNLSFAVGCKYRNESVKRKSLSCFENARRSSGVNPALVSFCVQFPHKSRFSCATLKSPSQTIGLFFISFFTHSTCAFIAGSHTSIRSRNRFNPSPLFGTYALITTAVSSARYQPSFSIEQFERRDVLLRFLKLHHV